MTLISDVVISKLTKLQKYPGKVLDANGNPIEILGQAKAQIVTPVGCFHTKVLIFKKAGAKHDMLLGMNVLKNAVIDFKRNKLSFSFNNNVTEVVRSNTDTVQIHIDSDNLQGDVLQSALITSPITDPCSSTALQSESESSRRPRDVEVKPDVGAAASKQVLRQADQTDMAGDCITKHFNVHLNGDLTIPKNSVTCASVAVNKQLRNGAEVFMHRNQMKHDIALAGVLSKVEGNMITINVSNFSDKQVTLKKGTILSTAEYITSESALIACTNVGNDNETNAAKANSLTADEPKRPVTATDIKCDDPNQTQEVLEIINTYRDACWLPGERLGMYKGDQLRINLTKDEVINKPPYRVPHVYQGKLTETVKEMLDEGTISRSKSSFNSPLIVVKQKQKVRFVLDYRLLNSASKGLSYPLPRIGDMLNSLGEAVHVSTLDLKDAYHQCEVHPDDREKTAFTVGNAKYEFNRIPFGLQAAPAFFARIVNEILFDVLGPQCLAYMDDIILFSKDAKQHLKTLETVLHKLSDAGIKVNAQKCHFFADTITFLGYQLTTNGLTMNSEKLKAIQEMPEPKNKKQLQALLGVLNYYRLFIANFATIAEPLHTLLRKEAKFIWTPVQSAAVTALKDKLSCAPILKFPDYSKEFHIYTDASDYGIGAILSQEYKGIMHPISCISRTLNQAQRNYSVTKKEALALVYALEQFRHIILSFPIQVHTDHKPLLGALKKPTKDECLQRWALLIQEYNINLQYVEGRSNCFADTLSRMPVTIDENEDIVKKLDDDLNVRNINCMTTDLQDYIPEKAPWTEAELRGKQQKDVSCLKLYDRLRNDQSQDTKGVPAEHLLNSRIIKGIVYVLRTITRGNLTDEHLVPYIPDSLMKEAFKLLHNDTTAGHKGPERTLKLFIRNFYNANERKIINELCNECEQCVKAKAHPKSVPISKYPIPIRPFHTVSTDILGPLRITESGNQFVLTFRDYTTRYTVLYPLQHKDTDSIINALRNLFSNYGSCHVLISDNASEYLSTKLSQFLKYYNVKKTEIAPYHPASQGLSERINREIAKLLRIYTSELSINDWDKLLPTIQLTINNTFNSSILESPFFALYGYDSSSVTFAPSKMQYSEDELHQHMRRIRDVRTHCRDSLLKAQATFTDYTNAKRKDKDIHIGQRVYAKLPRQNRRKLDLPVSGPFLVKASKGKAWVLHDVQTGQTFVTHPDYIIARNDPVQGTHTTNPSGIPANGPISSSSNPGDPSDDPAATDVQAPPANPGRRQQPARACKKPP